MILKTKRLILRPWKKDDAENLYEYAKDSDVGLIAGWPPHQNVEESRRIIESVFCGVECYAVCLKDEKAIGAIELIPNGRSDLTTSDRNSPVPLLNETRTCLISLLTKEEWTAQRKKQ